MISFSDMSLENSVPKNNSRYEPCSKQKNYDRRINGSSNANAGSNSRPPMRIPRKQRYEFKQKSSHGMAPTTIPET